MKARMADLNDAAFLIKARFDYFEAENFILTEEQKKMIGDQLRQYIPRTINRDFFAAVAENENGEIVSTAFLVVCEKPANLFFPTGKTGLVLNVLTYPDYRKKGYATNVLNLLTEEAKRQNVSFMELSASEMGKPLYEKLGFKGFVNSHITHMQKNLL